MARLFFSPEWLDELKSRCNIVDVISRYVPLKRNGRDFIGVCPFHHEKTPSFNVKEDGQFYHCFGCKESGDVIKFIQKYENLSFYEAVEKLANSVNMPLPVIDDSDAQKIARKKSERETILSALKAAARFYFDSLYKNLPQSKVARDYLEKRGVDKKNIVKFGIGCSPDFDSLTRVLREQGFSMDVLKRAGLVSDVGGRPSDAFGKRLMFPIINADGQVIGFSGRLLEKKDYAKYKNTAQTPVFNKSEIVFGINLLKNLREELRKNPDADRTGGLEYIILVEGQLDVITMHRFGFTNTVACLGTAVTPAHARRLKQFSDNIILLMDGDEAGRKAALRSIDTLENTALDVKVAALPDGSDPDEFLRQYGAEALKQILADAGEGGDYKIRVLEKKYDINSHAQKSRFIHESLVIIKSIENSSEQDVYLELVRKITGTPLDILRIDLAKIDLNKEKPFFEREDTQETSPAVKPKRNDAYELANKFILASLLYDKPYADFKTCENLKFEDEGMCAVFEYIKNTHNSGAKPNLSGLYSHMDVDSQPEIVKEIINYEFIDDPYPELTMQSYIYRNTERNLRREREELETQCSKEQDKSKRNAMLNRILEISKELDAIQRKLQQVTARHTQQVSDFKNK